MNTDEKSLRIKEIIRPIEVSRYGVDVGFDYLEGYLDGIALDYGGLNLLPDFQRGHVWTMEQRVAFMEALYRGIIRPEHLVFKLNIPHWENDHSSDSDLPEEAQIIDGLQRLTTVRMFLKDEFPIFGDRLFARDFSGTSFDPRRAIFRFRMEVFNFHTREELLSYYLAINAGGTPHGDAEISRVQALLDDARENLGQPSSHSHHMPGR